MSERADPTNDAGLVLGDDGVVYEVASDGTRTPLNSGSSSPVTVSQTFTLNRAGAFIGTHTFDLGSDIAIPVLITLTLDSFIGDGETLGNDPGTVYVGSGSLPLVKTNSDDTPNFGTVASLTPVNHFVVAAGGFVFELQGDGATPQAITTAARYVQVNPQLVSNDSGAPYAGANDPVAVATVSVTYLT